MKSSPKKQNLKKTTKNEKPIILNELPLNIYFTFQTESDNYINEYNKIATSYDNSKIIFLNDKKYIKKIKYKNNEIKNNVIYLNKENIVNDCLEEIKNNNIVNIFFIGHGTINKNNRNYLIHSIKKDEEIETLDSNEANKLIEKLSSKILKEDKILNNIYFEQCHSNPLKGVEMDTDVFVNKNFSIPTNQYYSRNDAIKNEIYGAECDVFSKNIILNKNIKCNKIYTYEKEAFIQPEHVKDIIRNRSTTLFQNITADCNPEYVKLKGKVSGYGIVNIQNTIYDIHSKKAIFTGFDKISQEKVDTINKKRVQKHINTLKDIQSRYL